MKSFVITITSLPLSVKVAERCISSADKFGLKTEIFEAVTPHDDPRTMMEKLKINSSQFKLDTGSRLENVFATFLSHYKLWELCANGKETFTIFEHDAVVVDKIPMSPFKGCMNIGAPSYGKFVQPKQFGVQPLISKPYFPGAHAYMLNPAGARKMVEIGQLQAMHTDVFLQSATFPWLEEYYPWPVVAKDTFTTIQNKTGISAKHNYQKNPNNYEIIKV